MYIDTKMHHNVCLFYLNKTGTNSLGQELLNELHNKVCWASEHDIVKVVVLTSKLPFGFSSGLDLGSFMDDRQAVFAEKVYSAVYTSFQILRVITQSPKIFIVALSGPVIGSAASIAFSCDFRIATPETWFWMPDTQYGGLLADGGIELLTKLIGTSRTSMIALTNDRINLDVADKWGLIYKTVNCRELNETAASFAARLCSYSFQTLSSHKKIINEGLLHDFREGHLKEILASEDSFLRLQSYMKINHKS